MPVGEIETHPYLQFGEIPNATRLILGSFPVYECTDPDSDFKAARRNDGTVRFFYGSNRNRLWQLYGLYVDAIISRPWNSQTILNSLSNKGIAISDTIQSCERYSYKIKKRTGVKELDPYSSEDNALHNHNWNVEQIKNLITGGVSKILCTSKGVLDTLEDRIVLVDGFGTTDTVQSRNFQDRFVEEINGNSDQITRPSHRCFVVQGRLIETLAIPSPGSPHRRLKHFGFQGGSSTTYAKAYFQRAFKWLAE